MEPPDRKNIWPEIREGLIASMKNAYVFDGIFEELSNALDARRQKPPDVSDGDSQPVVR